MTVLGVDLSLSSTGVAGRNWADSIKGPELARTATVEEHWHRLVQVRSALTDYLDDRLRLVVIEGPSYGSNDPGGHERAALWWWVIGRCINNRVPFAVVAPSTLKKYATGNGRADKRDVVRATRMRRPEVRIGGDDEADALNLAAMGLDWLGEPPVPPTPYQQDAVNVVRWPALVTT